MKEEQRKRVNSTQIRKRVNSTQIKISEKIREGREGEEIIKKQSYLLKSNPTTPQVPFL